MTRSRAVQVWFGAVALIAVACIAVGVSISLVTGATLLVMSLVPPAVMLLLWPGVQPPTIAEVLRGGERRD